MWIGVLAGLTTCALWGLTFVAPRAVLPFSVVDLTIARYATFGFLSFFLMASPRFRPTGMGWRLVATGLALGGFGYVGYFLCAAYAVRWAGAALPPIIIGTMPVIVALLANRRERHLPWRSLAGPLAAIALGVALININTFDQSAEATRATVLWGMAAAFAAVAIWVIYALVNSAAMRRTVAPEAFQWTGLQGIGAALMSLTLLPASSLGSVERFSTADIRQFVAWAIIMGVAASWLATACWAFAARRLPLTLASQLIVAETVFGLMFGFAFEGRWPSSAEWAGSALQVSGVVATLVMVSRQGAELRRA